MQVRVDGANGLRFPPRRIKGIFPLGPGLSYNNSFVSPPETNLRIPSPEINPNKAVFTIDSKTSQIMIVNNKACQLLGFSSRELCNMKFSDLMTSKNKSHVCALAEVQLNCGDGTMVLLSGKVVEMNMKSNAKVAVSLWIRKIENDGKCLALAEPVERRICQFVIDKNGFILNVDYNTLVIFQFETMEQLIGSHISTYIPAISLPEEESEKIEKNIRKQKATGKTEEGITFPLCLLINHHESITENGLSNRNSNLFTVTVWVFQNLSGLIVLDGQGAIESCNHHFSMLMFGYTQNKILNQKIDKIIPNFGQDVEYLGDCRSRNITDSSLDNDESGTETDLLHVEPTAINSSEVIKLSDKSVNDQQCKQSSTFNIKENSQSEPIKVFNEKELFDSFTDNKINSEVPGKKSNIIIAENNIKNSFDQELLTPVNDETQKTSMQQNLTESHQFPSANCKKEKLRLTESIKITTSISHNRKISNVTQSNNLLTLLNVSEGKYRGEAIHSDGNLIDILYTISNHILPCGRKVFCVWLCRDPDTIYDNDQGIRNKNLTLTFNSFTSNVEHSLGQAIKNTAAQNTSRPNSVALISQSEDDQIIGDFSKSYTTLKQIGKGAYGYVKMAYRNSDRLIVVAKFILKEKLCPQFMITTDDQKQIPIEIYLLTRIKHPNIVTVYDVFENENFFQLVMEKHGCGMDLFEFIDRRPLMDEKLGSFIFRQIANAVHYLHTINILHRDIKDENIIIDQNFQVKLIDFGSATFMEDGKLFSTFFGTTEYCSPEVLAGNKYAGPELEMWSLGVTLYVLMFFENPFIDIEETLKNDLILPQKISSNLENLLLSMLNKDPTIRCTLPQLIAEPWITQEVNSTDFNFAWIVPCESHEANPEKYFSGQIYSSTTALSTNSPQDSLSLVDDDSIIDGDEEEIAKIHAEVYECDTCLSTANDIEKKLTVKLNKQDIGKEENFEVEPSTSKGENDNNAETVLSKPRSDPEQSSPYKIVNIDVKNNDKSEHFYGIEILEDTL